MTDKSRSIVAIVSLVASAVFGGQAYGSAILLDFGSTLYTGTDSPGHADGLATGSTWNNVSGDVASGLVDENGAEVSGLAVDFGTGTLASISYTNAIKPLSVDHSAFPLWDDDLGEDHIVRDSGDPALAIAITGLTEGTYDFYFTGFRGDGNLESNPTRDYDVRWTTSTTTVTDFSGLATNTLTNDNETTETDWIAGNNYITGQFTVTASGEALYLYTDSPELVGAAPFIGVATSLSIVPIPEPASLVLLGLGGLLTLARHRR